jgi:hypothetical protein
MKPLRSPSALLQASPRSVPKHWGLGPLAARNYSPSLCYVIINDIQDVFRECQGTLMAPGRSVERVTKPRERGRGRGQASTP